MAEQSEVEKRRRSVVTRIRHHVRSPALGGGARAHRRLQDDAIGQLDALIATVREERDQAWLDTVTAERVGGTDISLATQILMDMRFCVRDGEWVKRDG